MPRGGPRPGARGLGPDSLQVSSAVGCLHSTPYILASAGGSCGHWQGEEAGRPCPRPRGCHGQAQTQVGSDNVTCDIMRSVVSAGSTARWTAGRAPPRPWCSDCYVWLRCCPPPSHSPTDGEHSCPCPCHSFCLCSGPSSCLGPCPLPVQVLPPLPPGAGLPPAAPGAAEPVVVGHQGADPGGRARGWKGELPPPAGAGPEGRSQEPAAGREQR